MVGGVCAQATRRGRSGLHPVRPSVRPSVRPIHPSPHKDTRAYHEHDGHGAHHGAPVRPEEVAHLGPGRSQRHQAHEGQDDEADEGVVGPVEQPLVPEGEAAPEGGGEEQGGGGPGEGAAGQSLEPPLEDVAAWFSMER